MPRSANSATPESAAVRYEPLAVVLLAAAAGIALDRLTGLTAMAWWLAAAMAGGAWLWRWRYGGDRGASCLLLLSVAALGGAWHHLRWDLFADDEIGRFAREAAQPVAVEAVVLGGPRRVPAPTFDPLRAIPTGDRSRLEVELAALRHGSRWRTASGRALVLIDGHLLGVHAGDRLRVFGQLSAPAPPANPGAFDFADYARGDRKLGTLRAESPDCVTVLAPGRTWGLGRVLEELRGGGDALLWRHLRHKRSGLAAALLLGAREELDAERTEAFFETGTVHILAISGMHIAILAGSLFYGLRLGVLPRRGALAAVAVVTLAYTLLTDSAPSAVRACALVFLVCLAQGTGRRTSAVNCLAAAALVVLAVNPVELFRVGAQLSFLAVAVLIAFGEAWANRPPPDPLERLIIATRPWPARWSRGAWVAVARLTIAGLAVWLVELPLVMAQFHLLSPAAVVLTTLSWVPVAVAMLAGFGVLVFGWFLPPLGAACGWLCDVNLAALDWMVGAAAPLPASHFWVPGPAAWWLAGFYGGLLLWWWAPAWRPPRRWRVAVLAGWIAVGLAGPTLGRASGPDGDAPLRATFVAVGHGLSVCLELPDGRTLLYDAGSLGSPQRAAESVAGFLWSRGITHLDAVVVSHADVDHYNGLPELVKRFSVGVVYVSPVMFDEPTPALEALQAALAAEDVPIHTLEGGQRLRAAGDLRIEVLHPPRRGIIGSDNANSVVLAIADGDRRILLTGDLESPGLEALLAEEPYDCDVLLAPHHGSGLSDPPGMATWSSPEWVVISGSHGFDSAAVERTYRARGARVLHTARDGAVEFVIEDDQLTVSAWRPEK